MTRTSSSVFIFSLIFLFGCERETGNAALDIVQTGNIQDGRLDEASGIQAARLNPDAYFLHNDDGKPRVFAMNGEGRSLGDFVIDGADNRDWEDISWAPHEDGPLIIAADVGDNLAIRKSVTLYFVREPAADESANDDESYDGKLPLHHQLKLTYPDGARDTESVAYDPSSDRIYLMSKRDKPPRVYSISLQEALANKRAELKFDVETQRFRPPDARDVRLFGKKESQWVAQPTGMDFSPDGRRAAVISYRSLFLFERAENETWPQAFARRPREFSGPPSRSEEAIAWSHDGRSIMVTAEKIPAPVYRVLLNPETP